METYPRMKDRKLKARWVRALRSGKYRKGIEHLRIDHLNGSKRYCCLGVLCEVAGQKYVGMHAYLPNSFRQRIGLSLDAQELLTGHNDGNEMAKYSFKRLADWIAQHL